MDELDEPLKKGFQMQFYICSSIVGVILSVNYSNYVCFSAMNPMLILACGKNIGLKVLLSGTDMCKRDSNDSVFVIYGMHEQCTFASLVQQQLLMQKSFSIGKIVFNNCILYSTCSIPYIHAYYHIGWAS